MRKWTFALMLIFFAARAGAYSIPYEMWMGTYVGEQKVGWMSLTIENSEYEGVKGYKVTTVVNNHMTVLGADMTQLVLTTVYTDTKYAPLAEEFSMSSGGKTTTVKSKFGKNSIECETAAGNKSIPIPDGVSLIADPLFTTSDVFPEVGKEYDMHYFNPLTVALEDLKIKVDAREKLSVDGKEYDTVKLQNITPLGTMMVWQECDGAVVQVKGIMGITMKRMSRKDATADTEVAGASDLADLTSAKSDKPIPDARSVKYLDAVLVGMDDTKMLINDSRQKASLAKSEDCPACASFKVTASSFSPSGASKLPIKAPALGEFLKATPPYIDSDADSITAKASEIVGSEKNAYLACSKIRAWIYGNLKVRADIGITRSGSDVLKSKVGVCRDYAILFASLARAAKIPSKVVSGLIYTDGAFYYHAWVECYVGKWVPFDATLASDFVDATHIKLAEGDATTMYSLAKVIGSLKVEVKESK